MKVKFKYKIGDKVCLVRPGYSNRMYNSIGIIYERITDPWDNPEYGINFSAGKGEIDCHIILPEEHIREMM